MAEPVDRIPDWTTKTTSYWGSPSGATYKVVKSGMLWNAFRYTSSKWDNFYTANSKVQAQKACEHYDLSIKVKDVIHKKTKT